MDADVIVNLNEFMDVSSLAVGFHRISVRFKSSDGHWSDTRTSFVYVQPQPNLAPPVYHQIIGCEYFIGTVDPGPGNAIAIALDAPGPIQNIEESLSVLGYPTGTYIISLRFLSSTGNWSNTEVRSFEICDGLEINITETHCGEATYNGEIFTQSGIYQQVIPNGVDCFDVYNLELTINPSEETQLTQVACDSFVVDTLVFTESGVYPFVYVNQFGCDSTVFLNLTVIDALAGIEAIVCDSYDIYGQTFSTSGNYIVSNPLGEECEQNVPLDLTILESTSSDFLVEDCGSYTWNGQTYTSTGQYQQTIPNAAGCDSLMTLNLSLGQTTSSTLNVSTCDLYTLNENVYEQSGTYQQILTNMSGCDSILTLNLTILESTSSQLDTAVCTTFQLNGIEYTQTGQFQQTLTNAAGCDSTIFINLTVNPLLTFGNHSVLALAELQPIDNMTVELFQIIGDNLMMPAIQQTTAPDGTVLFENVTYGEYLCRTKPNPLILEQSTMMATFSNETYYWPNAFVIDIGCAITTMDTIHNIILPVSPGGPGAASGIVYEFDNSRSFWLGDPIPGIPIILNKDTTEANVTSGNYFPFQSLESNNDGFYAFDNLPVGHYRLNVQVPGLYTFASPDQTNIQDTTAYFFTIAGEGPDSLNYEFLNFYVDADLGVFIDTCVVADIVPPCFIQIHEQQQAPYSLSLNPNPTAGPVTLIFSEWTKGFVKITVKSAVGDILTDDRKRLVGNSLSLNLAHLASGVYFLTAENESHTMTIKFVKL